MAYTYGALTAFSGIRTDLSESLLRADQTPDACNMDTRSGDLKSAGGFSRAASGVLSAQTPLTRLYLYTTERGTRYLATSQDALFFYHSAQRVWREIYRFTDTLDPKRMDFLPIRIGSDNRLLITHGGGQAVLYNAVTNEVTPFGSAAKLSDVPVSFAQLYFGRLFASGNMLEPCRLYWSKAPGGARTIDDWRTDAASENVSGGFVDIGIGDDPITGLVALSNQLLIITRNGMYRLLGDRPSNFRVTAIDAAFSMPTHTGCVRYADRVYFLTDSGLYFYDGQTVRRPQGGTAVQALLERADLSGMMSAACDDMLYFAYRSDEQAETLDRMIEYDLLRDCCMLRSGFSLIDLQSRGGRLFALTGDGKAVCFDGSADYDGDPIEAWWQMPIMDFGHKEADKILLSLTACGEGAVRIRAESNGGVYETQAAFGDTPLSVTEIPLRGVGRVFRLRFETVNGRPMRLGAKAALLFDLQRRPV